MRYINLHLTLTLACAIFWLPGKSYCPAHIPQYWQCGQNNQNFTDPYFKQLYISTTVDISSQQ